MYGYIYKTTNLITGVIYIGKRKGEFTSSYKGSGTYLRRALNKYGDVNFSVKLIEYCPTLEFQNEREKFWIEYYRKTGCLMYNIASGGDGGDTYAGLSADDRLVRTRKQSEVLKREYKLHKDRYAQSHAKAWKTRRKNGTDKMTVEQRQHLSEVHKGKKIPESVIRKRVQSRKGYTHSEETRRKISESNRGKTRSVETRKKLSENGKKRVGELNSFYGKTHTQEVKEYIGSFNKERFANRIWINDGKVNKRVQIDEIKKYKDLGFTEGRIKWGHNR